MSPTPQPSDWESRVTAQLAHLPTRKPPRSARGYLRRAQQGSAQAFDQLCDLSVELVFRYLYYGTGSERLAKVLTSTTYLSAKDRILEPNAARDDPIIWVLSLAREALELQLGGPFRLRVASLDSGGTLLEAITQTDAEQQECLILRYILQLSDADIAALTRRTLGDARALLVWSHAALAEQLELFEQE